MYDDAMTQSMKGAIKETERRRTIQEQYNKTHRITPQQIVKPIRERIVSPSKTSVGSLGGQAAEFSPDLLTDTAKVKKLVADYTKEMKKAARELDFEKAERLKNQIQKLKKFA